MKEKLSRIKLWVIDVDGTLTDGTIYYDDVGNEIKKFSVKDGIIFEIAQKCGMEIMILTGRSCKATVRRMKDLNPNYVYQGVKDKACFIKKFIYENKLKKSEIGYIGDDLNDLSAMKLVGFVGCPKDACEEVKNISNYISVLSGGYGAVRDIISYVLRESGKWNDIVKEGF